MLVEIADTQVLPEADTACRWFKLAEGHSKKGSLACPIGSGDTDSFTVENIESEILEQLQIAEGFIQSFAAQD